VIQILAGHGAKLDVRDYGNTDNRGGKLAVRKVGQYAAQRVGHLRAVRSTWF
jgi:hypothetical protein